MNLTIGGPSKRANNTSANRNSFHPIAITGRQANVTSKSAGMPRQKFFFMDHFNIGILIP